MKAIRFFLGACAAIALTGSVAFANPASLPSHPGYPAKGKSPVTGQSTANDQGQGNATGAATLEKGAQSHNMSSVNMSKDGNRNRMMKSIGAGRLPDVEGPLNRVKINPAGATSTVIR